MIGQFAALLKRSGLDFDDEDLADVLWLATKIDAADSNRSRPSEPSPSRPQQPKPDREIDRPDADSSAPPKASLPLFPPQPPPQRQPSTCPNGSPGIPIQVAAAPALRRSLELGRALRPLMRRVPSRAESVLDEEATANQIAEGVAFSPTFKPATERWLELALVVEESRSSVIWEKTIAAFQKLLERQGAFRDVRTWRLRTIDRGIPQLFPQRSAVAQSAHSPKELSDPAGRRLILLVSDCTSAAWHDNTLYEWLRGWAIDQPVAVLQLLPDRLWEQSALGKSFPVWLSALLPGVPNARLLEAGFPVWEDFPVETLKLPVMTLEPEAVLQWAKVVAGAGNVQTAGFVVDLTQPIAPSVLPVDADALPPKALLQRFRSTASRSARDLAGLLAAVPISLPIIHLIQAKLLTDSSQVQIAEVLMSGLLERIDSEEDDRSFETVRYDFVDQQLRDWLIDSAPTPNVNAVLEEISRYIAEKAGISIHSFTALLRPELEADVAAHPDVLPFAHIAKRSLRRMGGHYAALVDEIEAPTSIALPLSGFPPLQSFKFEVATIRLVPIADNASEMVTVELEPFEFEVATIDSQWLGEVPIETLVPLLTSAVLASSGKRLNDQQRAILTGSLANATYDEIRAGTGVQWSLFQQPGQVGANLWKLLTKVLGEKVTKANLQDVVARWALRQRGIQRQQQQGQHFIEDLGNNAVLDMVQIPAGSFLMGSPENEPESYGREKPQHLVNVPTFYMGRYPITQAQWRSIASLPRINRDLNPNPARFKGDERPVEKVSWEDAVEFCDRLAQLTDKPYRLPREAEWEYACRAGTATPFHFGETISTDLANYRGTDWKVGGTTYSGNYGRGFKGVYRDETTPVGSFGVANAFGLFDMHGNVWEWCADQWHRNYEGAPIDGSAWLGEKESESRLLRGGSWNVNPRLCRCAVRNWYAPDNQSFIIGFRVACSTARTL